MLWQFLKKFNLESPQDPGSPVLNIHSKEMKAETPTVICTPKFIAALLTKKAKGRNNPSAHQ